LLPEAEIHIRSGKLPPCEMARTKDAYPLERILEAATLGSQGKAAIPKLIEALRSDDDAIRFWGVTGLNATGNTDTGTVAVLSKALTDKSPVVRVAAAEALGKIGRDQEALAVLREALKHENDWVRHSAALALDRLGDKAKPAVPEMKAALKDSNQYVVRILRHAVERLDK